MPPDTLLPPLCPPSQLVLDPPMTPPTVSDTVSTLLLVNTSSQLTVATNEGSVVQVNSGSDSTAQELLLPDRLTQIFIKSCSRRNFAVNLVRELFSEEVRKNSNVAGRGKEQLDKVKYVKSTVFKFHPCTQADKVSDVWKDCIAMIDESNRRLNKHKKTA